MQLAYALSDARHHESHAQAVDEMILGKATCFILVSTTTLSQHVGV